MNGKKIVGWLLRGEIAAVMNVKQTYTVNHIRIFDLEVLGSFGPSVCLN